MHWGCALFWCSCVKHGSFCSPSLGLSTVHVLYVLKSELLTQFVLLTYQLAVDPVVSLFSQGKVTHFGAINAICGVQVRSDNNTLQWECNIYCIISFFEN